MVKNKFIKKLKNNILWICLSALFCGFLSISIISIFPLQKTQNQLDLNFQTSQDPLIHLNADVDSEQLVKYFRNVQVDDVIKEITDQTSSFYQANFHAIINQNFDSNNQPSVRLNDSLIRAQQDHNFVYEEINKHPVLFRNITQQILDGSLQVATIKAQFTAYKQSNPEEFQKILTKISLPINNAEAKTLLRTNLQSFSKKKQFEKIKDVRIVDQNHEVKIIPSDTVAYYTKLEKFTNIYTIYRDKLYGTGIASATLTAASWAIAAFYWAAWWMFGANVPLAIGATAQAGVSTLLTTETFNEYYKVRDEIKEWNAIIANKDFQNVKTIMQVILDISKKQGFNNQINWNYLLQHPKTKQIFDKFVHYYFWNYVNNFNLSKSFNKLIPQKFKNILQNINKRTSSFITKRISQKAVIKSLSWAANASKVLFWLDLFLDIADIGADYYIFSKIELNSW